MSFIEVKGLRYYYRIQGSGPTLLFLHGFTGSSNNWLPFLNCFSQHYQLLLLDLPGHGRTAAPEDPERYSMSRVSHDLIAILAALQLTTVNLIGYSMGGRLALYLATRYPALVNSLILESASPGLVTHSQRQARRQADNRLAEEIAEISVPAFIDRWQQIPLFATQHHLPAELKEELRLQRLSNSALGLANSLRGMGTGAQPSLWADLPSIQLPVKILAGELDQKFTVIAQRIDAAMPRSDLNIIPGAGHNVHLEKPDRFASSLLGFLAEFK